MRQHIGVVRGQRLEFVGGAGEGQLRNPGNVLCEQSCEARLGVEAGADGGAALGQRMEVLHRDLEAGDAAFDLRGVAGKFLAERQRRRVLGVVRPILTIFANSFSFLRSARQQLAEGGDEIGGDAACGRDVHRGRERVVRRLAHVDVIVGMHRLLGAELAAEQLIGAVGDDLVEVHVALACPSRSATPQAGNDRRACPRSPRARRG